MEIVINRCFGGFSISRKAMERMAELGHAEAQAEIALHDEWKASKAQPYTEYDAYLRDVARNDPILVQVVKELGEASYGKAAQLQVVEVDNRAPWRLEEYDGREHISHFDPAFRGCKLI